MKMPVLYTVFQAESNTEYRASKQQFESILNAKGFFLKYISCLFLASAKTFPVVLLHKFQHGVIDVLTDVIWNAAHKCHNVYIVIFSSTYQGKQAQAL